MSMNVVVLLAARGLGVTSADREGRLVLAGRCLRAATFGWLATYTC